ncbi:hypothetical protein IX324_003028 [Bacteroides pyogenes]|nr:hypothetical protein [Bacteroides pyogenes]
MGNYYHFVVLPCDPASPTQKALVEDSVRITYNRIYARLRNRTFHSLVELNRAVWELTKSTTGPVCRSVPTAVRNVFMPWRRIC